MVFNRTLEQWTEVGAHLTSKEIHQQPETWLKTFNQIKAEGAAIKAFISKVTSQPDFDIVLTGAGTSEFVGNSTFPFLSPLMDYKVKSYATTDIVAYPEDFLSRTKPTLLISFGRSGNSPESVAAVEAANVVCDNIYHLFVTCNNEGALSKFAEGKDNCYAINLTPETHDQSFAMTSSYTNMYLATVLSFLIDDLDKYEPVIKEIAEQTAKFADNGYHTVEKIVDEFDFTRIVYLGSNCLKGVSQESALKLCELTAGGIMTTYDTTMGFRHGPKSVICPGSLDVIYLSDDPYTRKYDLDIVKEMAGERAGNKLVVVSSYDDPEAKEYADYFISFDNKNRYDNVFLGIQFVNVGQTFALLKSIKTGVRPDTPCPSGKVNRVVKGVNIYPYSREMRG
ncbi:MAG: SIS domain-containing protein [Erysipelotrichaceae bacterium]|nr:SIS domain-containing protein [Erysipelotrichaceae bacterium]